MAALTIEEARDALDYDPATGVFYRRSTASVNPRAQKDMRAGSLHRAGYRVVRIKRVKYLEHRLAWFMSHGYWPENDIDHINGVKDDNRIENLREATRSQNMANAPRQRNNTTGHKGVHFDKLNGRWMAYVNVAGRFKNLGRFDSLDAAIAVREQHFRKAFGDFARA